MQVFNLMIPRF